MFDAQVMARAFSRAWFSVGKSNAINIPMIEVTTINSIRVKASSRGDSSARAGQMDLVALTNPRLTAFNDKTEFGTALPRSFGLYVLRIPEDCQNANPEDCALSSRRIP